MILTFDELEAVLGFPLPQDARNLPEWWSNAGFETPMISHAWAWTLNDRTAHADLNEKRVVFKATSGASLQV